MRVGGLVLILCCGSLRAALAADSAPPAPPASPAQPPQVPSSSPSELSGLYDRGATAFAEGRYAEAVRAFEQAYRMKPAPSMLFNIARAYDRLFIVENDEVALQRAIDAYRQYLAEGKVPRQREAIERLEALTLIQAKRKPAPAPQPQPLPQYPVYQPQVYQPFPMPVYVPAPVLPPSSVGDPYAPLAPPAPKPTAAPAPKPVAPPPAKAAEAAKRPAAPSPSPSPSPEQKPSAPKREADVQWVPAAVFLREKP